MASNDTEKKTGPEIPGLFPFEYKTYLVTMNNTPSFCE